MFFVLHEVHQIVLLRLTLQMSLQGPNISGDQYQKSNTIFSISWKQSLLSSLDRIFTLYLDFASVEQVALLERSLPYLVLRARFSLASCIFFSLPAKLSKLELSSLRFILQMNKVDLRNLQSSP